jgi:hypothetical protein
MTCGVSGIQGMSIFSSGIQGIGPNEILLLVFKRILDINFEEGIPI